MWARRLPFESAMSLRAKLFALTTLPWLVGCGEEPRVQTAEPAYLTEIVSRYPDADRVVALGDVHGDLDAMREAMSLADVLDEHDAWIGGETVVVRTGDLLDRGNDEQDICRHPGEAPGSSQASRWCAARPQRQPRAHERRPRLQLCDRCRLRRLRGCARGQPRRSRRLRLRATHARTGLGLHAGRRLRQEDRHLSRGVGGRRHPGGVLPSYAGDIEALNLEVAQWVLGEDDRGRRVVEDDDSPVWSRH